MLIAFLIIFGVGLSMLLATLFFGELFSLGAEIGHELGGLSHEVSSGFGDHGITDLGTGEVQSPSPLSSSTIFSFTTGLGGIGAIGTIYDWPIFLTILAALAGGIALSIGVYLAVILPISKQQGWTKESRNDLLNLEGQVASLIPAVGFGQVTLVSPTSGARVVESAKSAEGEVIPVGVIVKVVQVGPGTLIVSPVNK